jgi:hypothetical protein
MDEKDFLAGIEKFAALKREENNMTSPIWALLVAK